MPIQVPRLTRNAPIAAASAGQLNVQAPNLAAGPAAVGETVGKIAGQTTQYFQQQQDNAWDTEAQAKANEFDQYISARLEGEGGLKYRQGDPTAYYGELAQDIDTKYEEFLGGELGERQRGLIKQKLDQVYDRGTIKANTIYGHLYNKFESKVTEDGISLEQKALVDAVSISAASSDDTFSAVDQQIQKIRDLRWNYGRKVGLVEADEEGRERANESLRLSTAKDISDGLYKAVDVLNAAGRVDEAEKMMAKYKEYMDPTSRKKATETTEKAAIRRTALELASQVKGMTAEETDEYLEKNAKGVNRLEIQNQALQIVNSQQRHITQMKGRQESQNFEIAANLIRKNMADPSRLFDLEDMRNHPEIKQLMPNMNSKQIAALTAMVDAPKASKPETMASMYDVMMSPNGFEGMSYAQLQEQSAGLSKTDRGMFEKYWREANLETPSEKLRSIRTMDNRLREKMLEYKMVKNTYGRLSDADNRKFLQARTAMEQAFSQFPPGMNVDAQLKWVDKWVADTKNQETFTPPSAPARMQPVAPLPTATPIPKGAPPASAATGGSVPATLNARIQAGRDLQKQLKRRPTPAEIDAFMKAGK